MTRMNRLALGSALLCLSLGIFGGVSTSPLEAGGFPPIIIPEGEAGIAWLGENLFFDARLSSTGTVSCAKCHDPEQSFTDGVRHSVGEQNVAVGRNSPTLIAIGEHDLFVDPLSGQLQFFSNLGQNDGDINSSFTVTRTATATSFTTTVVAGEVVAAEGVAAEGVAEPGVTQTPDEGSDAEENSVAPAREIEVPINGIQLGENPFSKLGISLAERCLSPLGNQLEMGSNIDTTIENYRTVAQTDALFDRVFAAEGGVTRERVGLALAAYLRTLAKPAAAPYSRYLSGETHALDEQESRGLALFSGKGSCASCHAGESLRDGLVHASRSASSQRPNRAQAAQGGPQQMQVQQELVIFSGPGFGGNGYGGLPINIVATPTLWNVAQTAPYFGDGSIASLEETLALHVKELHELRAEMESAKKEEEALAAAQPVASPLGPPENPQNPTVISNTISNSTVSNTVSNTISNLGQQRVNHGFLTSVIFAAQTRAALERIPEPLRPSEDLSDFSKWPVPDELTADELDDILSFLGTLSPRAM